MTMSVILEPPPHSDITLDIQNTIIYSGAAVSVFPMVSKKKDLASTFLPQPLF